MRTRSWSALVMSFVAVLALTAALGSAEAEVSGGMDSAVVELSTWEPAALDVAGEALTSSLSPSCEEGYCPTCKDNWLFEEHQHGCGGEDWDNAQNHVNCEWLAFDCEVDHDGCAGN